MTLKSPGRLEALLLRRTFVMTAEKLETFSAARALKLARAAISATTSEKKPRRKSMIQRPAALIAAYHGTTTTGGLYG